MGPLWIYTLHRLDSMQSAEPDIQLSAGRFLEKCCRQNPECSLCCIDFSPGTFAIESARSFKCKQRLSLLMRAIASLTLTLMVHTAYTYNVHTEGEGGQKIPQFCGFSVHKFQTKGWDKKNQKNLADAICVSPLSRCCGAHSKCWQWQPEFQKPNPPSFCIHLFVVR